MKLTTDINEAAQHPGAVSYKGGTIAAGTPADAAKELIRRFIEANDGAGPIEFLLFDESSSDEKGARQAITEKRLSPRSATTPASTAAPDLASEVRVLRNLGTVLLLVILAAAFVSGYQAVSQPVYEYDIVYVSDTKASQRLREIGGQGWKIVGSRRAIGRNDDKGYEFVVERTAK
ncbi:hypothetical protein Mal15_70020 [Stieleria maiorica]|uniref:DUF4177 domain-containing protein n=1 Tax=Stieleria maiorica TaxID=2795974 RepID=A0A5B9MRH9_9BACT|nr:hypothetical protein [Stieleria maiorica]QEG02881.1 hypothetical protein Mal15_70020 [Stieleria maiorica]